MRLAVASLIVLCLAFPSLAYEVIEVEDGGTLTGTVKLVGPVPPPKAFNLVVFPDPEYCGRISDGEGWRLLKDFTVGPEGQFKDVVVMLEGIQAGKPFSVSVPRVEARDCRFLPFVSIVRDGHGVEVVNMDPVMHDVQAYETSPELGARVLFNSPLPFNHRHNRSDLHATHDHQPGRSLVQQFRLTKGRRTFLMQCGFHAFMESWAFAVTSPYYAITDEEGRFNLDQIPPGTYLLRAWHPYVSAPVERFVTIEPNETLDVTLDVRAPVGRRTAHTMQKPPRFGPGAIGRPSLRIRPIVQDQ